MGLAEQSWAGAAVAAVIVRVTTVVLPIIAAVTAVVTPVIATIVTTTDQAGAISSISEQPHVILLSGRPRDPPRPPR